MGFTSLKKEQREYLTTLMYYLEMYQELNPSKAHILTGRLAQDARFHIKLTEILISNTVRRNGYEDEVKEPLNALSKLYRFLTKTLCDER